jgi:hypothetical protein
LWGGIAWVVLCISLDAGAVLQGLTLISYQPMMISLVNILVFYKKLTKFLVILKLYNYEKDNNRVK